MFFDSFFFYHFIMRKIWFLKFPAIFNIFFLPFMTWFSIFFPIRKLELLEHPKIFNYVYFFRFFLGRYAFITSYNSFFHLGLHWYSFDSGISFSHINTIYIPLFFIIYEVQPFLNLQLTTSFAFSSAKHFTLKLLDLNIFTEKKTNAGLFYLLDFLYLKAYLLLVKLFRPAINY